jgi:glycosyltransferase involved in cell wall biosynthesis
MTPPRVLVATTYYHPVLGGVETHARQLASHLRRAGFGVEVVTKRVARTDPREEIIDNVPIHRVGPAGERNALGKWVVLPAFFATMLELKERFDAIVCVDYRGIGLAAIAAGSLLKRPVIVQGETAAVLAGPTSDTNSGLPPESAIATLLKAPARAVYRRADHILCIGRDLEAEALRAGVDRERVHYQPPGVDLSRFHPPQPAEAARLRTSLGWPHDRRMVLFVGRLSVEKGAMDLVEAWRLADPRDAVLTLVGPDMPGHAWDVGARARAYVAAHGLTGRVRFEGPASDTSPFFRAADAYAHPSHFEAFGSSALEAMASGLPIVASGVGGLADFLVDGENALLHQPKSPASLASALTRLLDDEGLRARLAAAALQTARQFEIGTLLDRVARLIESAVGPS